MACQLKRSQREPEGSEPIRSHSPRRLRRGATCLECPAPVQTSPLRCAACRRTSSALTARLCRPPAMSRLSARAASTSAMKGDCSHARSAKLSIRSSSSWLNSSPRSLGTLLARPSPGCNPASSQPSAPPASIPNMRSASPRGRSRLYSKPPAILSRNGFWRRTPRQPMRSAGPGSSAAACARCGSIASSVPDRRREPPVIPRTPRQRTQSRVRTRGGSSTTKLRTRMVSTPTLRCLNCAADLRAADRGLRNDPPQPARRRHKPVRRPLLSANVEARLVAAVTPGRVCALSSADLRWTAA